MSRRLHRSGCSRWSGRWRKIGRWRRSERWRKSGFRRRSELSHGYSNRCKCGRWRDVAIQIIDKFWLQDIIATTAERAQARVHEQALAQERMFALSQERAMAQ
ncbi:hypothetical protein EVAR_67886_1 [Eumeta japonica]|uniref:Uncharacterized protein n=1 Tax=Eumeta variegata TaxID=151549 RepID=A0A4C2A674_EUMVA|nr:hypothetical protein EVAR_67886_1 [Eumeta japonica]